MQQRRLLLSISRNVLHEGCQAGRLVGGAGEGSMQQRRLPLSSMQVSASWVSWRGKGRWGESGGRSEGEGRFDERAV